MTSGVDPSCYASIARRAMSERGGRGVVISRTLKAHARLAPPPLVFPSAQNLNVGAFAMSSGVAHSVGAARDGHAM
jgi:hypothetical protein